MNDQTPSKDSVGPTRWPEGRSFGLFLSHDIDQIHDREFFRVLADVNHIRRMLLGNERGNVGLAMRRVSRALLRPKPAEQDFETLLRIEGRHGFRSTFFVLHDPYWRRHGPRYTLGCGEIRRIARMILDAGGELGVHGGIYRLDNADGYRESRLAIQDMFGVDPVGIRNHHLKFSGDKTWLAQEAAGFRYDCTYGWPDRLGPRDGDPFPFFPVVRSPGHPFTGGRADAGEDGTRALRLLELPLTVMDTTLFRYLGLEGAGALEEAWRCVETVARQGGLVSLLWHNNFFNEPEYRDWQEVYEALLERLAALNPWCATGAEIDQWCRTNRSGPGPG